MARKVTNKMLELITGYCRIESDDMNIIQGIIKIIFEYHRLATWSRQFKGDAIELSDDDTKATNHNVGRYDSVRANFGIQRGETTSWELEVYQNGCNAHFYGVVSSKRKDFDLCPYEGEFEDAYGIDDWQYGIYQAGERYFVNWNKFKPQMPVREIYKLKMIADWTDNEQCKLSIFYKDKKMNEDNDEYTLLLPRLDKEYVWYPCVSPYSSPAYCIIRYI